MPTREPAGFQGGAALRARTIEYGSDFARSWHAQGKAEGKAEGRAEGKAEDILAVLKARGIGVTPSQETLVKQCTSLTELDRWLERAATANSADEVFS